MGQTHKRFTKNQFDDEKDVRHGKQAGKRHHSRHFEVEDEYDLDLEDNKYKSELEFLLKRA